MTDTTSTEPVTEAQEPTPSEVNAAATEAAVAETAAVDPVAPETPVAPTQEPEPVAADPAPEPAAEQPVEVKDPDPKTLPWEPTAKMIDDGREFIARCIREGLTPHPRGVYQTMFAAYSGE